MPPVLASAPSSAPARPAPGELLTGYLGSLTARGVGNSSFLSGARAFLKRWPDLRAWEQAPLPVRLSVKPSTRPLLNYLMLAGQRVGQIDELAVDPADERGLGQPPADRFGQLVHSAAVRKFAKGAVRESDLCHCAWSVVSGSWSVVSRRL